MARRHNSVRESSEGSRRVLHVAGDSAPPDMASPDQTPEQKAEAAGWVKGQLLNVRNAGSHYNVTLLGEEYDPRQPERCLRFTSPNDCQDFVSRWYAREGGGRPF